MKVDINNKILDITYEVELADLGEEPNQVTVEMLRQKYGLIPAKLTEEERTLCV